MIKNNCLMFLLYATFGYLNIVSKFLLGATLLINGTYRYKLAVYTLLGFIITFVCKELN